MMLEQLLHDLRDAVRSLKRQRSYTITALTTLALGIGATTAIYTVVHAVILAPLPFPDAERLVQIYATPAERGEAIAFADLEAFRSQSASFETMAGYGVSARYLRGAAGTQRVMAVLAERSFFATLAVPPVLGRGFLADDPANVAVVSHAFWTERLSAAPSAIGTALRFDDQTFTILGVMPASFRFPYGSATLLRGPASESRTDVWMPSGPPGQAPRGRASVIARLRVGTTVEAAASELSVIAANESTRSTDASRQGRGVRIEPLAEAVVSRAVRQPLFFLIGAVLIVLALVCANLTNFSLVRMTLRKREVAVRAALGARPRRLVRQLLIESLLLATGGGVLGLLLAKAGLDRLLALAAAYVPRASEVSFDWPIFLFLLLICAITGTVSGLAPALAARHADPHTLMKETGSHATVSVAERRLRDGLVVAEVAFAFVLALGGTMLVRELLRLRAVETGLVASNVVTLHLGQRMSPRPDPAQFEALAARIRELQGVAAAGLTQMLPLQNWGWFSVSDDFRTPGRPPATPSFQIELRYVTSGYFEAVGMTLARGRGFAVSDTADAPPVIVINDTLARQMFGDEDPVGIRTSRGTIVGIVRDVRQVHVDRPASPEIYFPVAQNWSQVPELGMTLVVRTAGPPEALIGVIRAQVREQNPTLAIFNVKLLASVVEESLSAFTLYLWLIVGFAMLAIVLACTGTYGVIASLAAARAREFAIRTAIGADNGDVLRLVLGQGVRLTLLGLLTGSVLAIAVTPLLKDLPVTVRPPSVAIAGVVAAFVAVVAMTASLVPARRSARTDVLSTLRAD
jgi:putative ABC transport system permease protein